MKFNLQSDLPREGEGERERERDREGEVGG